MGCVSSALAPRSALEKAISGGSGDDVKAALETSSPHAIFTSSSGGVETAGVTTRITALQCAVVCRNVDAIRELLDAGAEFWQNNTESDHGALSMACTLGHTKELQAIVGQIKRKPDCDFEENEEVANAMCNAASEGATSCLQALLSLGWLDSIAVTHAKKGALGLNPLHLAARQGSPTQSFTNDKEKVDHAACVGLLLEHSVDVEELSTNEAETALHYAARAPDEAQAIGVCKRLLEAGCPLATVGPARKTAADYARDAGRNKLAELLAV